MRVLQAHQRADCADPATCWWESHRAQSADLATPMSTSWVEWRVTGEPGQGYPPYDFTFGSRTRRAMGEDADPEAAAREFIAKVTAGIGWVDGPHLAQRTVTETEWEPVA